MIVVHVTLAIFFNESIIKEIFHEYFKINPLLKSISIRVQ